MTSSLGGYVRVNTIIMRGIGKKSCCEVIFSDCVDRREFLPNNKFQMNWALTIGCCRSNWCLFVLLLSNGWRSPLVIGMFRFWRFVKKLTSSKSSLEFCIFTCRFIYCEEQTSPEKTPFLADILQHCPVLKCSARQIGQHSLHRAPRDVLVDTVACLAQQKGDLVFY